MSIVLTFFLALFFYPIKDSTASHQPKHDLPTTGQRLQESIPMLTTSLSTIAFVTVDIFLLSLFLGPADVGIYAAAAKLVAFISFPLMAIIGMIAPQLSALDDTEDRSALQTIFRRATGFAFWFSLPIIVAIVLFPDQLLTMFGEGFEQATSVIFILLLGHVATVMLGPIGYLLWMTGYASELQRVTLFSLGITITLCLILIPLFGINGSAVAITSGLLIKNLGSWKLVSTHLEFNPLYLPWDGVLHALYRKR
jgi:O-antigen/teichoic acid export membrane protein